MLIVLAVEGTIGGAGAEETGAPMGCGEYSFGFAGTRLVNDGISDSAGPYTIELPAGTYDVTLVGADDHSMSDQSDQTGEQWYVALDNGWQSTLTDDLPDDADTITTSITGQQLDAATAISVHHAGEGNVNSIDVVCVGFTSVGADMDAMDSVEGDASDPNEDDEMIGDDAVEGDADPADGDASEEADPADDASDETDPADGDASEDADDDTTAAVEGDADGDAVEGDETAEASAPEEAEAADASDEQEGDEEIVDASESDDDEGVEADVGDDATADEAATVSDDAAADEAATEDDATSTDNSLGAERPEAPHEASRIDDH